METAGARVLLAGGAHRVGRAVALDLAAAGAHVAISYHASAEAAERTRAEIEALGVRTGAFFADAAEPGSMAALVESAREGLGGLDVYVHAPSGGFEPRAPEDVDEALWTAALDSTAKGFLFGAQAAHRHMRAAGGGVIVALNDVAGVQPWPRFAAHCAAKAAQAMLVKCLAAAWGRDGVRVAAVAPGPVLMPDDRGTESSRNAAARTALGALGEPRHVAQAVRFLIECDYATGQSVAVDGGRLLVS